MLMDVIGQFVILPPKMKDSLHELLWRYIYIITVLIAESAYRSLLTDFNSIFKFSFMWWMFI